MKRVDLELELLTDVSVPESSRTLGGGRTLDYVPGRALWGAAATAAFRQGKSAKEALELFWGDAVRILDAVPMVGDARAFPSPRSWHEPKYGGQVLNLSLPGVRPLDDVQYRPVPTTWRTPDFTAASIERRYSLRTSVGATGRAREGLLFGIDAIPQGTRLHGRLEGEAAALEQVLRLLEGELRVGRSRSAELGLVRCKAASVEAKGLDVVQGTASRVRFLCCSRLALRDAASGAPTFRPRPEDFGLPGSWAFEPEGSFVRSARYSPFNGKWVRPELERHVIDLGSVLTFCAEDSGSVDLADVRAAVAGGVGVWRTEGLGQVVVEPSWLTEPAISLPDAEAGASRSTTPAPKPADELFEWASAAARDRRAAREAYAWAVEEAQRFAGPSPSPSQWGLIHRLAREARHRQDGARWLRTRIERHVSQGVSSLSSGWGSGAKGERLKKLLESPDLQHDLPRRLELLAGCALRSGRGGER